MKWKENKAPSWHLLALAVLSLIVFMLAEKTATQVKQPRYRTKIRAAQTTLAAQQAIRDELHKRNIAIDLRNDPWGTGLIGEKRTVITSDRGVISAKVLATNPNFAAAFVDLLHRAGVRKGDKVAIGMTGSLPGWDIAMLAACKALKVEPVVISSVGASDWGANRPDLTWLDMERLIREKDVMPFKSVAASMGGGGDYGRGLSPEGRRFIRESMERCGVPMIDGKSLEENIQLRMTYYDGLADSTGYAAYINIGGGLSSLGGRYNNKIIPAGFSRRLPPANYPVRAVINRMSEKGIPIINLTNVLKMAEKYSLTTVIGPEAPDIGIGTLYFKGQYNISTTIMLTIALALIVFGVIRVDIKHYLGRRKRVMTPRPGEGV